MNAYTAQVKLAEIQDKLITILSTFSKPSDYQDLLIDFADYRDGIYAAVAESFERVTVPILKGTSSSTLDQQKQALNDLQGVIDSIEMMIPGNISEGFASPQSGYTNRVRLSRAALIASLYTTYQAEYSSLYE
jgi:hypothetical protein